MLNLTGDEVAGIRAEFHTTLNIKKIDGVQ